MYCNGCSYTYGIGTAEFENVEDCLSYSWPNQLAKILKTEHINEAQPGSSNARIFRDSALYLINNPDTELAVTMWSDAPRIEIFRPQETEYDYQGMAQITPQGVGQTKSYFHREALESYYAFVHSTQKAVIETLGYMIALQNIADNLNIPLIQQHYKANISHYLWDILGEYTKQEVWDKCGSVERAFYNTVVNMVDILKAHPHVAGVDWTEQDQEKYSTSMRSVCITRGKAKESSISLGHPYREAHVMYAEFLSNYIKDNNVLS
jgi:hypothetical protein